VVVFYLGQIIWLKNARAVTMSSSSEEDSKCIINQNIFLETAEIIAEMKHGVFFQ